jgi:hypothetical protein
LSSAFFRATSFPLAQGSDEQLGDGAQVHGSRLGQAGNARVRQGDHDAAPVCIGRCATMQQIDKTILNARQAGMPSLASPCA